MGKTTILKHMRKENADLNSHEGELSGKVGTGLCSPERVLFWLCGFTNGPFFF